MISERVRDGQRQSQVGGKCNRAGPEERESARRATAKENRSVSLVLPPQLKQREATENIYFHSLVSLLLHQESARGGESAAHYMSELVALRCSRSTYLLHVSRKRFRKEPNYIRPVFDSTHLLINKCRSSKEVNRWMGRTRPRGRS